MKRWMETLYFSSPVGLQNLGVSAYGFYLHRTRYGGSSEAFFRELLASERMSEDEQRELRVSKLRQLLTHAHATVPYYREVFDRLGFRPERVSDLGDLRSLPLLEKDVVRESPERLVSQARLGRRLTLHTSGTTGSPMVIRCDAKSRQHHYAFLRRMRAWAGVAMGTPRASFFGRIVASPDQSKPPFWRHDASENNHQFSSYHMSEANLPAYYEKLASIEPVELSGYPSSLLRLATWILERGLQEIRPKFITTTAETLMDHQREAIEAAYACRVTDQYGCTEMAIFVSQCELGSYHVHPEYGVVEVLDQAGNPVGPGGEGEAVCTGFVNQTMPLIRYRLGDRIALGDAGCACGRPFPVVERLLGRVDDVLVTPEGRILGRLDPVFKGVEGIRETQVVQPGRTELELNIVRDASFRKEDEEQLLYELRKRVGSAMEVRINYVGEIPRDSSGKFRAVISLIDPPR